MYDAGTVFAALLATVTVRAAMSVLAISTVAVLVVAHTGEETAAGGRNLLCQSYRCDGHG